MSELLLASFYATMVAAGLTVEFVFQGAGLTPGGHTAKVVRASISWNYTAVLNIVFLCLAGFLVWRFVRSGGVRMPKMMNTPLEEHATDTPAEGRRSMLVRPG